MKMPTMATASSNSSSQMSMCQLSSQSAIPGSGLLPRPWPALCRRSAIIVVIRCGFRHAWVFGGGQTRHHRRWHAAALLRRFLVAVQDIAEQILVHNLKLDRAGERGAMAPVVGGAPHVEFGDTGRLEGQKSG